MGVVKQCAQRRKGESPGLCTCFLRSLTLILLPALLLHCFTSPPWTWAGWWAKEQHQQGRAAAVTSSIKSDLWCHQSELHPAGQAAPGGGPEIRHPAENCSRQMGAGGSTRGHSPTDRPLWALTRCSYCCGCRGARGSGSKGADKAVWDFWLFFFLLACFSFRTQSTPHHCCCCSHQVLCPAEG